jgi:hypothetical protein
LRDWLWFRVSRPHVVTPPEGPGNECERATERRDRERADDQADQQHADADRDHDGPDRALMLSLALVLDYGHLV